MIAVRVRVEPLDGGGIPWRDRLTILRAQLTLVRTRAEQGIPVSVECLERTEEFARGLEPIEASL